MADKKSERTKPHVQIGTIGHVDYGKTDLNRAIKEALSKRDLKANIEKDIDKSLLYEDIDKKSYYNDVNSSIIDNAHEETDELKR